MAALGFALHRPLARVPENTLKFAVGVLLSAFGTFWAGEGLHLAWPGDDLSILGLVAAYLLLALVMVPALPARCGPPRRNREGHRMKWLATIGHEIIGLFVDDGSFALAIVVWVALIGAASRFAHHPTAEAVLLFLGLALLLVFTAVRFARRAGK